MRLYEHLRALPELPLRWHLPADAAHPTGRDTHYEALEPMTAKGVLVRVLRNEGAEVAAHDMIRREQHEAEGMEQLSAEYLTLATEHCTALVREISACPLRHLISGMPDPVNEWCRFIQLSVAAQQGCGRRFVQARQRRCLRERSHQRR